MSKFPMVTPLRDGYTVSEETERLQKRVGLAEAATKASRDKAHQLEDVR